MSVSTRCKRALALGIALQSKDPAHHKTYIFPTHFKDNVGEHALQTRASFVGRARQLETFPESGARQEFLSNQHKQYLYLIEWNYKVIYRIEEQVIYIIQIFDSRQDPNKMKD